MDDSDPRAGDTPGTRELVRVQVQVEGIPGVEDDAFPRLRTGRHGDVGMQAIHAGRVLEAADASIAHRHLCGNGAGPEKQHQESEYAEFTRDHIHRWGSSRAVHGLMVNGPMPDFAQAENSGHSSRFSIMEN